MVFVTNVLNGRIGLATALLASALALPGSPVRADAPEKAGQAKANTPKAAPAEQKTPPPEEAISPRWIGPTWEIKGLTVWVFTPGHFEGR